MRNLLDKAAIGVIMFMTLLVCAAVLLACSDDPEKESSRDMPDEADLDDGDGSGDVAMDGDMAGTGQPGDECAAAAQCMAGLVCAYNEPTDMVRSCIDPLVGWVDDGSGPEVEAVGPWIRKRVAGWAEQGAVCNDGSPYMYFVSPGRDEGADKWLIFFKGGGSCSDPESCANRWAIQNSFMRQPAPEFTPGQTSGVGAGIFARDRNDNFFADWNYVYLFYCTSDQHSGTRSADEHPTRWHFRGHHTTQAAIEELINGIDITEAGATMPQLSDADTVVLAGGSAGAVAVRNNLDSIASRLRQENPTTVTLGMPDSIIHPAILPEEYQPIPPSLEFHGAHLDADCIEAHPDLPALCSDGIHLTTGGGARSEYFQAVDQGHLGVAGGEELAAAEGVFTFMGQFDEHTLTQRGKWGWCVRTECSQDADCGTGQGCLQGRCYSTESCEPLLCSPEDVPCLGLQGPPACLGEVATHPSECNTDSVCPGEEGCCEEGEECMFGYCIQEGFGRCEDSNECDDGFVCDRGVCSRGAESPEECPSVGYTYEPDTMTCRQALGCSERNPCDEGYTCLPGDLNPIGQGLSWGIREALSGLEERSGPRHGVYVPASRTHTALNSRKYFGESLRRIRGNTLAEVVYAWMLDDGSYEEHVDSAGEVPLLLWAEPASLSASGVTARTSGSGCADSAVGFILCHANSDCDQPADMMVSASVGDTGVSSASGNASFERLKLVIRFNGSCSASALELAPGAHLVLDYSSAPGAEPEHTVKIALPSGVLGEQIPLPVALFVGADGATWRDAELTELAAGRLD